MEIATNFQVEGRIKRVVIILCALLLSLSCKKDEDNETLPPLTTIGAGSFGFLLNNEVWLPKQMRFPIFPSPSEFDCNYFPESGRLWISARREYNDSIKYEDIYLEVYSIFHTGQYSFDNVEYGNTSFERVYTDQSTVRYSVKEFLTNNCEIMFLDTTQKIISGTFNISLFSPTTNKRIDITNGIFDLKY